MKQKLLLKTMLLLFALIAGSSSVWADDPTITLTQSALGLTGSYSSGATKEIGGVTFTHTDLMKSTDYIQAKASTGVIYNSTAFPTNIKSVAITHNGTARATTIFGSANGTDWTQIATGSGSITGDFTSGSYKYFKITRGSNAAYWSQIVITYTAGTPSNTTDAPTITGNTAFLNTTTVTIENSASADGATIYYTTDGNDPTTSSSTYSAPFTVDATTTVKAIAKLTSKDASTVVSKTFKKATPTTVAAALTAINALADNGTIEDQCVAGIISQIDYFGDNAITYWISDDGTKTSQLEVFKGKGLNGANFAAKTDMNVGDEVTVFGTLKKYVNGDNTTPEFDAGSLLLSYAATGTPIPAINASNVTIDSEATSGEITYTIDNATTATLTAAEKEEYDWISNVTVTASKVTFTVTQNSGTQRVGYITLSYEGATSKDVKITQKATYGTASLPFAFDSGKSDIENTAGLTHGGLGSDYDYSPKLKFDHTDDYLVLKINGAAEKLYFDIKGNSFSGGTFKVQTSADGQTYTDLKSYTELAAASHEALDLASTVRYIKWIYANKSAGNVGIGRIGIDCEAAYIPSAGYATYTTPNNIDFTGTGVTAYKVSAIGADNVTLEEVTEAPAGTPLVLQAAAGNYCLNIVASAAEVTGNQLQVSDGTATTTDANTVYALASKGEPAVVGFYKVKAGTKVPAGKGYLSVAVTSAPEYLGFGGEGNTTGMNDVRSKMEEGRGEFYNLNGQRVAQPTKGLYIVNGRKVIIK